VLTEFGREYRGMSPNSTRGESGDEVRKRIDMWNANVESAHSMRKKMYWKTMGCWARRRKLLSVVEGVEEVCFSIRAQVR